MDDQYTSTGNSSLSYTAPTQKSLQMAKEAERKASATQITHQCYASIVLQAQGGQRSLGTCVVTVVRLPDNAGYKLIIYDGKTRKPLSSTSLNASFRVQTLPNNYCRFTDDRKQVFAAYFGKEKGFAARAEFLANVLRAQEAEITRLGTVLSDIMFTDLMIGADRPVTEGDMVDISFQMYLKAEGDAHPKAIGAEVANCPKIKFKIGNQKKVITGIDKAVRGMAKGGKRFVVVPATLAYGERTSTRIPRNATLLVNMSLNKCKHTSSSGSNATAAAASTPAAAPAPAPAPASTSTQPSTAGFIASQTFAGEKPGFVFRAGPQGNGYYRDPYAPVVQQQQQQPAPAPAPAAASLAAPAQQQETRSERAGSDRAGLKARMARLAMAGGMGSIVMQKKSAASAPADAPSPVQPAQQQPQQPAMQVQAAAPAAQVPAAASSR